MNILDWCILSFWLLVLMALARWCQFWKFVQPNWPLLSLLPSFSRHLRKTSFPQLFTFRCPFMNKETLTKKCVLPLNHFYKKNSFSIFCHLVEKIDWISIWGMLSPFCPNQSHFGSWIRKTLHHLFSQSNQRHIKTMLDFTPQSFYLWLLFKVDFLLQAIMYNFIVIWSFSVSFERG